MMLQREKLVACHFVPFGSLAFLPSHLRAAPDCWSLGPTPWPSDRQGGDVRVVLHFCQWGRPQPEACFLSYLQGLQTGLRR
jgi:hypothetical protein